MYDKRNRSLIARLRAGCLYLEIERGRWRGTPRTERICKLCFNGIEHELHFLFYCNKLQFVRTAHDNLLVYLSVNCINDVDRFKMLFSQQCLIPSSKFNRALYDNIKSVLYSAR